MDERSFTNAILPPICRREKEEEVSVARALGDDGGREHGVTVGAGTLRDLRQPRAETPNQCLLTFTTSSLSPLLAFLTVYDRNECCWQ